MAKSDPPDQSTAPTAQRRLLDALVQERGLRAGSYALFFMTGEGKELPGSTDADILENATGYVIDQQGMVFTFWLDWDEQEQRPTFLEWRPVVPQPDWMEDDEFRRARAQVGLPAALRS